MFFEMNSNNNSNNNNSNEIIIKTVFNQFYFEPSFGMYGASQLSI